MEIQTYHEAIDTHGGIRPAARALGIAESTLRSRLKRAARDLHALASEGVGDQITFFFTSNRPPRPLTFEPMADRPRYFILTSAQDSSAIHEEFWQALNVYAEYLENCEILIGGYTYSKTLFEDHETRSPKVGFHPSIDDYIVHEPAKIGTGVTFCGEMNTLPTAVKPLSGFETYTRDKWGVFPHPKVQLVSVPTMKGKIAKQIMTTGSVTLPNYIRKKAGIKASFHHVCGAVLVELAPDGSFWCRHLLATSYDDGSFYDLDLYITPKGVTENVRVEALTYGDIHHEKLDPIVAMTTWGYDTETSERYLTGGSLIEHLRPNFEFYHDLSDFAPRNHHNIKDHHFRFATHYHGVANVESALHGCATFLQEVARDDCQAIVVESNHDQALVKWLKTADYRDDPENAEFFLRTQANFYRYLASGVTSPPVFEDVLRAAGCPADVEFVNEDNSFMICGDIECGMHGHLGANGAKASPNAFTRMGSKSNTGHTHSPAILDGAYVSGVSGSMDMGYNKGLSSWAHAHIVTYANGKRAILTMMNGRWYA
ncbi:hypothetical protein LAV_00063 [Sphingobium phage Lacusarx]|uniref:DNA binding HTH domain-containing protein n=1 Tax=Sphingobium phage Lacusarx TaxID=1980139 RepID=A0A1W6DX19_9CAUD|nr:DNA transfer protein [Sphingobium phage Lacusarx]ARK07463.1 hypothetical protein LAV_00063 [Sphingobium phage Lacusarx]